jgi:dihydrofolate reductase
MAFEVTVLFEALANTTKVTMRSVFPNVAEFEKLKGFGAAEGGQQALERLADWLNRGTKLRVHAFTVSVDGYGAGPNQSLDNPLGVGGAALHEWAVATRTFQKMFGSDAGTTGVDDNFAARGFHNIGAWILGRNMFGPVRGSWPDDSWKGWWGDDPPYHVPVFVLTHHPRASITMAGGTTFHFITDGIYAALKRATEAANGQDVRIGGGVATIKQYLRAGLVDEMHLAIAPVVLGSGEPMFSGLDMVSLGYRCTEHVSTQNATHVVVTRPR